MISHNTDDVLMQTDNNVDNLAFVTENVVPQENAKDSDERLVHLAELVVNSLKITEKVADSSHQDNLILNRNEGTGICGSGSASFVPDSFEANPPVDSADRSGASFSVNSFSSPSNAVHSKAFILITNVTPISNTGNQMVAKDMRIVSSLWGDGTDEVDDEIENDDLPITYATDPSKYLNVNEQDDFTPVLSKSKKKKLRKKTKQVQKDAYNTRSNGGFLSLLI